MDAPKPWYQSKTLWLNIISGFMMFLALPEFISLLPESALPIIGLLNALGNLILRFMTSVALKM